MIKEKQKQICDRKRLNYRLERQLVRVLIVFEANSWDPKIAKRCHRSRVQEPFD